MTVTRSPLSTTYRHRRIVHTQTGASVTTEWHSGWYCVTRIRTSGDWGGSLGGRIFCR